MLIKESNWVKSGQIKRKLEQTGTYPLCIDKHLKFEVPFRSVVNFGDDLRLKVKKKVNLVKNQKVLRDRPHLRLSVKASQV